MKTIKVIDLLNKIANGEDVPKKIGYDGGIFEYNDEDYHRGGYSSLFTICTPYYLTDEVEIIEEDKEIEKIDKGKFYGNRFPDEWEEHLINKIDEIIDVVNELNKK